ncbi:MAG: hypothetical protein MPI95_02155 [Nitrosopumilus sp.]|nr:hypothetical protein [Nitrosopumilus sp.]MDA7957884.1 hypothetical protein [Nitrosopumilus sp.]
MGVCEHRFRRDFPPNDVDEMESKEVRVARFRCTRPGCNKRKVVRRNTSDGRVRSVVFIYNA